MAKQRVSLTLDEDLVERIDRKVDTGQYTNRSQAVEQFLKDHLQREKVDTAIILCGGEKDDPDSMINVNGKPVLQHTIEHLDDSGLERVILAVGTNHESITNHFGKGDDYGLSIEYITEEEPLGTAGSLRRVNDMLQDTFLLMNGDVLCRVDIEDMVKTHRDDDVLSTIALTTVDDISPYGVVRLKGDRIIGFKEKPDEEDAPSNLINAGVYLLEPEVIDMLPSEDQQQKVGVEQLFEKLADRHNLKGYVYEGTWQDLGS
ncbi:MAG: sugar phosphate nucleotidyltransferase [Candidatus Nanohaloarchaea archaeon]|nr:sugar phosphate nucleotidyltransferase [Candidatus Nanohaloarchaea archaeon]